MNKIRELRTSRGLSQKDLGSIINVSQQTISRYEQTNSNIPNDVLIKLSQFFQISIEYLLAKNPEPKYNTRVTESFRKKDNILDLYQSLDEINQQTMLLLGNRLLDVQTHLNTEIGNLKKELTEEIYSEYINKYHI
ncbi:MAG: helix-turn-helix domain-containing protein [Lachnospiraceae bacterium]